MALAGSTNAFAQSRSDEDDLAQVYGDKMTVSIATGSSQSLRRAPAVATVITAQDIALLGAMDLDQVLATVPGVDVSHSYQGYAPLYIIRGIYSVFNSQTLVLHNGVPLTTMFIGSRGSIWAGMPVSNIARVEVIRGPGSALYGADAYAGVINIVTKGPEDVDGLEVGVRSGSLSSRDAWLQYGGTLGPVAISTYLRAGRTEGFKGILEADGQTGLDDLFGTHASRAPGPVNTEHDAVDAHVEMRYGKLRLRGAYLLRDNVGMGVGAAEVLDREGHGRNDRWLASASLSDIDVAPKTKLTLNASYYRFVNVFTGLRVFPPGAFGGQFPDGVQGNPNTWEQQIRSSAVLSYGGWDGHQLRLGVGHDDLDMYRTQEFKNFSLVESGPLIGTPVPLPGGQLVEFPVDKSFATPQRRLVTYGYVQDEWQLHPDWTLTTGLRYDRFTQFGSTTNPRMALVWDASLNVTAKLLVGRAFRAPSFSEAYSINNPVIRGNPNLKPEQVSTVEAAVSWQVGPQTQLNANVFHYRMTDIIRQYSIGGGISEYENAGTQSGRGLELELTSDVSRSLRLTGHLALQRSVDRRNGTDAGFAPHQMGYVRADWHFDKGWSLSGQAKHVANRLRQAGDLRPQTPDYTSVDMTLRMLQQPGWDVAFSVRNLLNADIREPSASPQLTYDLPTTGRLFDLQVTYRF